MGTVPRMLPLQHHTLLGSCRRLGHNRPGKVGADSCSSRRIAGQAQHRLNKILISIKVNSFFLPAGCIEPEAVEPSNN